MPFGSNPASLGEADECAVGDDEVIEKADVDEGQRAAELQRDAAVGFAGLGDPGRVVVEKYQCRGVVVQGLLNDDPGIDGRPVDGALEEFGHPDQPMARVEVDHAEHFIAPPRELQAQELLDVLRRVQAAAAAETSGQHFQGEGDDGGFFGARQRRRA